MAGEDPEMVHIEPGQNISVLLERGRVTRLFAERLESPERPADTVSGVVEQIDLEKQLTVRLNVDGEARAYAVDPKAHLVVKGREFQIAPWDRQFGSKSIGQRAMSIFAGPLMNFVLAFTLFVVVMFLAGMPVNVKIEKVEPGSPAERAGLLAGDVIASVNGEPIGTDMTKLTALIRNSADREMEWVVKRDGREQRIRVTPERKDDVAMVGIRLGTDQRSTTVGEALRGGAQYMAGATSQILIGFKMLVLGQFTLDDLGGPVRIVEVTGEHASAGLPQYTFWAAILSLYLGLFNLLPFPALDGSRLVFLALEAVRGKPVDPNRESMVHFIGFAMLMLLMIAVTYNDILRLIKG
jgi:regulator of sigma E protease